MPTQTFFHLPKEKQDTVIKAALKEFTKVSFENASINQIIKEASISRGSFYMYFQDKEDLYFYLLEQFRMHFKENLLSILAEEHGDLFRTFERLFEQIVEYCLNKNRKSFFKRVFTDINSRSEKKLFPTKSKVQEMESEHEQFLSQIDTKKLNVETRGDLEEMVGLLFGMTLHTLVHSFVREDTKEEMISSYQRKLELLKNGMMKR